MIRIKLRKAHPSLENEGHHVLGLCAENTSNNIFKIVVSRASVDNFLSLRINFEKLLFSVDNVKVNKSTHGRWRKFFGMNSQRGRAEKG